MRSLAAPLALVAARVRRRRRRWLLPALGIALTAAFAGAVAVAGTVAGDHAARSSLDELSPLDRTVRVTAVGLGSTSVPPRARDILGGVDLGPPTRVVLLRSIRLGTSVVRPAAISPLDRWVSPGAARAAGRCRPRRCAMLAAEGYRGPARLATRGARIAIVARAPLRSAVPLGFTPGASGQQPVLLSGDLHGFDDLRGLRGVYRAGTWLAALRIRQLHSWELQSVESQLRGAQSAVSLAPAELSMTAPFHGLARARVQARAGPRRLLLVAGGGAAALALFFLLAAGALRRDQRAELARLDAAGATTVQSLAFVAGEAALVSGAGLAAGAVLAVGAGAAIAALAGEPAWAVLTHSLLTPQAALVLGGAWIAATAAMTVFVFARSPRIADALALAAVCVLAAALALGQDNSSTLALLLAPLACVAAAVAVARGAAVALRGGERLARRGPVVVRLALINLVRSPGFPSLAIAFVAVSVGLGGFALSYRETLARGAADQAANRVPLDATVSAGADFTTPLERAPLARWRRIAAGPVFPVRRTEANYPGGDGTVTVPALGVPAAALPMIHGWRTSDGPLDALAGQLRPTGPIRTPGPSLAASARSLAVWTRSPSLNVTINADLRDPQGSIRSVRLGVAHARPALLRARLPRGRWEVSALELHEQSGLEITAGHQNGESAVGATQSVARITLGPLFAQRGGAEPPRALPIGAWRGVGAASGARPGRGGRAVQVRFATSGAAGVVRPTQPSDTRPVPLLADPGTAGTAGPGGRLSLTVAGQPVTGRVIGTPRRFPTVAADAGGFVIADEATLAGALDARLPGEGRPDELWVSTSHPARLEAALRGRALGGLHAEYRTTIENRLRGAPLAQGVLDTLFAAVALAGVLTVVALVVALAGAGRDERAERDLEAQGIGPRGLRAELRARFLLASAVGVIAGVAIAALLVRLAVAAVRAAGAVAVPRPPLVTVLPWGELALAAAVALALLSAATWLATRSLVGREETSAGAPQAKAEGAPIGAAGAAR